MLTHRNIHMGSSNSSKGSSSDQGNKDLHSIEMRRAKRRSSGKGSKKAVAQTTISNPADAFYACWSEKYFNLDVAAIFDRIDTRDEFAGIVHSASDFATLSELTNRARYQLIALANCGVSPSALIQIEEFEYARAFILIDGHKLCYDAPKQSFVCFAVDQNGTQIGSAFLSKNATDAVSHFFSRKSTKVITVKAGTVRKPSSTIKLKGIV